MTDAWMRVRWRIDGSEKLVVPSFAGKGRADDLWQTTCFELFIMPRDGTPGYSEFNLSPSERWAAYDFTGYREGMAERAMIAPPQSQESRHAHILTFDVQLRASVLPPRPLQLGLTAVIEEEGGVKSYWAIAHPPGAPDFHAPTCFAATLPPPEQT